MLLISDADPWEEATVLYTASTLPTDPRLAPNLKFIQFFSAGTDHVVNEPVYQDSDILLTTSSGIHGPQIAEWVVMEILSHSHREKTLIRWQQEHKWGSRRELEQDHSSVKDCVGQRLGVLGYGSIGRQSQ
jgi:phosphoglycerate dehydrogenase-like enzyme